MIDIFLAFKIFYFFFNLKNELFLLQNKILA
jgi:hypothetical protein